MDRPPRRAPVPFRPRFTLMVLYFAGFYAILALLIALPPLLRGFAALPPGGGELSPEELARAREIARGALAGGRLWLAFAGAVLAVGGGAWFGLLPGLRVDPPAPRPR